MLIIICGERGSEYIAERRLIDAESWDATVQHIAEGQFEDISGVRHTGLDVDVLDIIAKEVAAIWRGNGEPLTEWQTKFIEYNISVRAANKFPRAA